MTPEEIEPRVADAVRLLQKEIDESFFYPRRAFALDEVLLMVTGRCLRTGLAVCQLVAHGFYGDAFGLSRTVLEAFLIVKYVSSKDTESRAESYLGFGEAYALNQEKLREKYFPNISKPERITPEWIADVEQRYGKNPGQWIRAWDMASDKYDPEMDPATGEGIRAIGDYNGMYRMMSHYVHCSVVSARRNYLICPSRTPKNDVEQDKGFLALHAVLAYASMTGIILGRGWEREPQQEVHHSVLKLMKELRDATSPSDWAVGKTP